MKWILVTICIAALLIALYLLIQYQTKLPISAPKTSNAKIRYVPIGDSYTIGHGVNESESYPSLLTKHLQSEGIDIELVTNPAVSGWTTQMAIDQEMPVLKSSDANFTTVLIGANDAFQNLPVEEFKTRFISLLNAVEAVLPDKTKIILITIPDYSVSPAGVLYGDQVNTKQLIQSYNSVIQQESKKRNLMLTDIFPLTESFQDKPDYFIADGLHPAAKQYVEWEKLLYPKALFLLKNKSP